MTQIGQDRLRELGPAAMAKAWTFGAILNLGAPAIMLSPPVAQLPRTGFYDTPSPSLIDKTFNFVFRSDNAIYATALLIGLAGLAVIRIVQLVGFATVAAQWARWPSSLLFLGWIGFILVVNGPIASPKYRLPLEPVLMALAGIGYCTLRDRRARQRP